MYSQMSIGECPECGDELYVFRTKSRKKVVKCLNDDCPKQLAYGVPKSGKIEVTGLKCPKSNLPVLAIIPNIRLAQGKYKQNTKGIYFWTNSPCFTCREQNSCEVRKEAKEDYD